MIAEPLSAAALKALRPDVPLGNDKLMAVSLKRADGKVMAVMGLIWKFGGCFLWLDVLDEDCPAHAIVRTAQRMLKQAAEMGEQRVFCQIGEELRDERLLTLSGFADLGDTLTPEGGETERLMTWRSLQPSPQ